MLAAPGAAFADPAKDLQVAGRALTFLENGPTGRATLGVVFDPSKPASVAEKDAVMAAIGGGYSAGTVTLVGKPVEAGGVAGASGVNALYVTKGVNYAAVGAAAKAKKLVTIGSDPACVGSGACVMGVTTTPKVEITVNRSAAASVGAAFKAAFRMMIKEI
ncbi:hypothetical protein [Phenylobacterium zucineum]|uniref:hypothetical protein n=1 Tax=Phenylobacterium zucineum TaxID=284016 RepID=UPI0002E08BFA|nr:hypothetical protein [Phenylobacterium zucineum]